MHSSERLDGWKEIADYLGRSVRSVQRWEAELALPVRRLRTKSGQVVYAHRAELDEWLTRTAMPAEMPAETRPGTPGEPPTETPGDTPAGTQSGTSDGSPATTPVEPRSAASAETRPEPPGGARPDTPAEVPAETAAQSSAVANAVPGHRAVVEGRTATTTTVVPPSIATADKARWPWALALVAAILAGLLLGRSWNGLSPAKAEGIRVVGRYVEGRDSRDAVVWRHTLDRTVHATRRKAPGQFQAATDSVASVDLDGDGTLEFLVPVRPGIDNVHVEGSDVLLAFDETGGLKWSVSPDFTVTCAGTTFSGPWQLFDVEVSKVAGPKRVWVSYGDHNWWPDFIVEVTPRGAHRVLHFQPGWIHALAEFQTAGGTRLVAGGVLNDHQRGSLTFIDPDGPPTALKSSLPEFQCSQDGAPPERVVLFPRLELSTVLGIPYEMVNRLSVQTDELVANMSLGLAFGWVNRDGRVRTFELTDIYWKEHRDASRFAVKHTPEECPERRRPFEIREWTPGGGWNTYQVAAR